MKTPFLPNLIAVGLLAVVATGARADYSFNFTPFTVTAPDSLTFGNSTNVKEGLRKEPVCHVQPSALPMEST